MTLSLVPTAKFSGIATILPFLSTNSSFSDFIFPNSSVLILHSADKLLPSVKVAVIIASPPLFPAFTTPLLLTVAISVLLLLHVNFSTGSGEFVSVADN